MATFQGMPTGKNLRVAMASVATTDTTATKKFNLPKGSRIVGFVLSGTASNAGTTATLSIGSTTTANEYVNGVNVLAAGVGNGVNVLNGVAGALDALLKTSDNYIYVKYAETGTASTLGSWRLFVLYTDGNIPIETH